jgi:hypothetical protein
MDPACFAFQAAMRSAGLGMLPMGSVGIDITFCVYDPRYSWVGTRDHTLSNVGEAIVFLYYEALTLVDSGDLNTTCPSYTRQIQVSGVYCLKLKT